MTTLHVRSVPEDLYDQLLKLAQKHNRSLSAQVITMLADAVELESRRAEQNQVITSIHRRRFKAPPGAPTSLELLKEDRQR